MRYLYFILLYMSCSAMVQGQQNYLGNADSFVVRQVKYIIGDPADFGAEETAILVLKCSRSRDSVYIDIPYATSEYIAAYVRNGKKYFTTKDALKFIPDNYAVIVPILIGSKAKDKSVINLPSPESQQALLYKLRSMQTYYRVIDVIKIIATSPIKKYSKTM